MAEELSLLTMVRMAVSDCGYNPALFQAVGDRQVVCRSFEDIPFEVAYRAMELALATRAVKPMCLACWRPLSQVRVPKVHGDARRACLSEHPLEKDCGLTRQTLDGWATATAERFGYSY